MTLLEKLRKLKDKHKLQYVVSFSFIVLTAVSCYAFIQFIDYRIVALILLLVLSIIAMLFAIRPVLFSAILSAMLWNFFFIPPVYTFSIGTSEDVLLFLMYFVIAMLNAVLTSKIRKAEMKVREKEEREHTLQLYDTILSSLSHELRTPIATIVGAVDTLKENKGKLSQLAESDLLNEMDKAGFRLNRQVENLLNMSRLESGFVHLQLDWTDVSELVYSIVENYKEEFEEHPVTISANESLPLFKLDRGLIEQVVYNLLHNAVQYTPSGSPITVGIEQQQEMCRIKITDNGKGFPKHSEKKVFEKFYRLPHTASGGTGLGLSIVKGFVEAHGGKVDLYNNFGKGATFVIEIPAETALINPEENA